MRRAVQTGSIRRAGPCQTENTPSRRLIQLGEEISKNQVKSCQGTSTLDRPRLVENHGLILPFQVDCHGPFFRINFPDDLNARLEVL